MKNMRKITMAATGFVIILLAFGAMTIAMAQDTTDEITNDTENHECTLEMMENAPENCPDEMMQSGDCEKMMTGGCGEMMDSQDAANDDTDHCGDMGTMTGGMA